MKILLTSYFALPNPGGLWTYVLELYRGLEQSGHHVDLIVHAPQRGIYYLPQRREVFVKKTVSKLVQKSVVDYFKGQEMSVDKGILEIEVERYILECAYAHFGLHDYDILHTQDIISTRAASRVKQARTPLIATIHGNLTKESHTRGVLTSNETLLYEYMVKHEKIGITSSDRAIMPSSWLKQMYEQDFQVPEKQMYVIPNGMNINVFNERMKEPLAVKRPTNKKVIACNARFDQVKGHPYLFQALAKLKKENEDWVCWLIGDGELRGEYEQLCKQLHIEEHVIFLGKRDDVPALLYSADLCVLPSIQENCPFAIMEAQLAGKAIIASEVGGIPEMIEHGITGLLTPPGQSDALYQTLKLILEEDDLRKKLGNRAQKWGRNHWSISKMRDETYQIYKQVMQQKKGSHYPK